MPGRFNEYSLVQLRCLYAHSQIYVYRRTALSMALVLTPESLNVDSLKCRTSAVYLDTLYIEVSLTWTDNNEVSHHQCSCTKDYCFVIISVA